MKKANMAALIAQTKGVGDLKKDDEQRRAITNARLEQADAEEAKPHPGLGQFPVAPPAKDIASNSDNFEAASAETVQPKQEVAVGYTRYEDGMEVLVGMHLQVPLEMLEENAYNSRGTYVESDIEEMARTMEAEGQMQAALVYPPTKRGGKMMLKEGQTRFYGAQRNKAATLKVEVVEPVTDPLQAYKQSRELNKRRKTINIFDDAIRFRQILNNHPGMQSKELASLVDESEPYTTKALKVGELPEKLILRMLDSKELFGVSMAYSVALYYKKTDEVEAMTLLDRICAGEISSKRLQEMLSETPKQTSPDSSGQQRARPLRRNEVKGGGKGELKLFPQGRIEFKLHLAERGGEEVLFEKLRALLTEHGLTFGDEAASA